LYDKTIEIMIHNM